MLKRLFWLLLLGFNIWATFENPHQDWRWVSAWSSAVCVVVLTSLVPREN